MFAPLPEEKAKKYCTELMQKLDAEKRIDFETPLNESDAAFSTDCITSKDSLGQMFGVCVCIDQNGHEVVLKAFSGQFNSIWNVKGWVPPLLDANAFYETTKESDLLIHQLTDKIEALSKEIKALENEYLETKPEFSQIQELKSLRRTRSALQKQRKTMSQQSMTEIFALYKFYCADGKLLKFSDIFEEGVQPPTGCGECCAPKLLSYAFQNKLTPVSLAEFFYGTEPPSKKKQHKQFYTPCDEKCAPILPFILGLEILYQDSYIVVINKPSGLLSIPGRGEDKLDSVTTRLKRIFPQCIEQPSVHRLDMDTSGLLVLALDKESHKNLSIQFMEGKVHKKYVAFLKNKPEFGKGCKLCTDSVSENTSCKNLLVSGKIELPFRLDVENRPHQIYDEIYGKWGITNFQFLPPAETEKLLSMFRLTKKQTEHFFSSYESVPVSFEPETGRTHQLRLHSSCVHGLNAPIIGDNLYGTQSQDERLMLHACELSFTHPKTGEKMFFRT